YLINETGTYHISGSYHSAEAALKNIKNDDPHVVLLDVELPGMSGLEALPKIKLLVEDVYVIMLTVYDHEKTVFEALSKGAAGYLTKDTAPGKIIDALGEVLLGGGPMSAHIARMVVHSFQRSQESPLTR